MIVVNIAEAKANLSHYVDALAKGERVIIAKWNRPVAELRPIAAARTEPRPIGGAKGVVDVPPSFFDPLPEEWLNAFEGTGRPLEMGHAAERRSPRYGRHRIGKPRRGGR